MNLAQDMLAIEAKMWKAVDASGPATFKQWLLDNGECCAPRVRRRGLTLMTMKQCFSNSLLTIMRHEVDMNEWFYTEGVVANDDLPIVIDHAWLTNREGEVLDRTLRSKGRGQFHYYGIPFTADFAYDVVFKQGHYGLFSNGVTYNRSIVGQPVVGRAWEKRDAAE